ncbi:MAG: cytochrome P450 [Actinomycetota bacterium]|nr:cytochrome P450 [Actinomycetota bacterium]
MRRTLVPPGPDVAGLSAIRRFRREPIGLLEEAATHGDISYLRLPRFPVYLLNHPDLVRDVLVGSNRSFRKGPTMQAARRMIGDSLLTTEGEVHRRQRRLIQPLFHHERIAGYARDMVALASEAAERWGDGERIDVHREMARLTLAVVARTLFGTDLPAGESRDITDALAGTLAQFDRVFSPLLPVTERLPLPATRRFRAAHDTFDRLVYGLIERRRAEGAAGSDLLSMLLRAQEAGAGMTDTEVRDEAITLFLAGHETTSSVLTWTWYLLSQHPAMREAWHAELATVLGDRPASTEDLPDLRLTDAVLHEAIRLYPPAWAIGRTAVEPHEAGGYRIPAGATVVVSPWLVHRDPRWFPEPAEFRPARWPAGPDPRHAYVPFGAGPRVCIGEPFAWMEAALLLATIGQRWSLELATNHRVQLQPVVTLRPGNGMPMIARARGRRAA